MKNSNTYRLWIAGLLACVLAGCDSAPTDSTQAASDEVSETVDYAVMSEGDDSAGGAVAEMTAKPAAAKPPEPVSKPPKPVAKMSGDAFRIAAHDGRIESVRRGIASGTDVNAADARSLTALHMAAYNGHSEIVKLLLEQNVEVDPRDFEGKTPLLHACTGPFAETVEILIDAGADVNAPEATESFTPLMMAAGLGQTEVVKVLLRHKANKSAKDDDGDMAIDHARNAGYTEIVKLLEES